MFHQALEEFVEKLGGIIGLQKSSVSASSSTFSFASGIGGMNSNNNNNSMNRRNHSIMSV